MASQNESDQKYRDGEVKESNGENDANTNSGTGVQTQQQQAAPFSEFDPFRSTRIDTLRSEADQLLESLQVRVDGIEDATETELRNLHKNVSEYQGWSQTRKDAFTSVLRLGKPTPTRSNRIL